MRKRVFDVIAGYSVNEGMDSLLQNEEYIKNTKINKVSGIEWNYFGK